MTAVNPALMASNPSLSQFANVKDSRWLTLEVCREFTRQKCTRPDTECKFAHPPPHVEVQNGRVTCCFDSIKGKCQRKDPPCKYLHPPQHLREQLLQNGRNNLILRNLQMQALAAGLPPMVPSMMPAVQQQPPQAYMPGSLPGSQLPQGFPYGLSQLPQGLPPGVAAMMSGQLDQSAAAAASVAGVMPSSQPQQKVARPDRLEPPSSSPPSTQNGSDSPITPGLTALGGQTTTWSSQQPTFTYLDAMGGVHANPTSQYTSPQLFYQPAAAPLVEVLAQQQHQKAGSKRPRDPNDDLILQGMSAAGVPGMVPMMKRPAMDKSGIPMYQPHVGAQVGAQSAAAYQQALAAMQLQQNFVPVTMPLLSSSHTTVAGAAGAMVTNANNVSYFDDTNQLLDTLPVCRDFKSGQCKRPQCKYVHLLEDYVEVSDGMVTVCRDAAKGKCSRPMCKYYHVPLLPHLLL